jgi:hypothetical protein
MLGLALASVAGIAIEATFPAHLRLGAEAPDLLAAAAAFAAARPGGSLAGAAAVGLVRDAASGGVAGRFTLGYLLAALLLRALFGRLRTHGLASACGAAFLGAGVAHLVAGVIAGALGRGSLLGAPADALEVAILTAAFAPLVIVPLAALETAARETAPRPELGGTR